ncbi:MAG: hypothetical protein Q9219_006714 [cf. Caloplaca sp. 3 TL-2023]
MTIALSDTAIWGIGIGGSALVIIACAGLIILWLRKKHTALLATTNRDTERSRAHLSITDEDVMRMPGTRRIRPSPYNQESGWVPISSRENVAKRGLAPNPADVDPITGLPPWPVRIPRRLKKTQSSPVVRVPLAALSPITERSTNNAATSPSLSKIASSDVENQKGIVKDADRTDGNPAPDASPGPLTPKPLFHGQPRSLSHGTLTGLSEKSNFTESVGMVSDKVVFPGMEGAQLRRSSSLCSRRPGQPPSIPVPPLPFDLPANRRQQPGMSPSDASPQRISGMSLLSGDTSLLDEMVSRGFSQADTDLTSINLTSPPASASPNHGLGISVGNSKWNFSRVDRAASPLSTAKARNVRPQISQQHSFRASIHNSLPRSASSGLSMSLLDHNSPNPKAFANLAKANLDAPGKIKRERSQRSRVPQGSPLSKVNVFKISEEMKSKRASTSILQVVSGNQVSPVKNPWTDRPISIATEDPFRWSPKSSMQPGKPSAMKKTGHQRQKHPSCVRISNIPTIIPSQQHLSAGLRSETRQPTISPLLKPITNKHPARTSIRPPSTSTFNPQLPKGIRSTPNSKTTTQPNNHNDDTVNHPYSPTFSMIPLYEPPPSPTSSSSSIASTPTRNPSLSRPPARNHPNRRHAIFPSANGKHWPPLLSSSITPTDPPTEVAAEAGKATTAEAATRTDINEEQEQEQEEDASPSSYPPPTPSSLFLSDSFPSPPIPQSQQQPPPPSFPLFSPPQQPHASHHPPTTSFPPRIPSPIKPTTTATTTTTKPRSSPLRGPRPLPRTRILKPPPTFSPTQRSSIRSRSRSRSRSGSPNTKLDMLRRSIVELRRMNSEVRHSSSVAEGEYLSLGLGLGSRARGGGGG